jgi:DNA-binding transcriptional MerR regulator
MQINAYAQETNLSAKTIRYYEEVGLLPPAKRLDNGYRDYDDRDVARARFVSGARSLDFSIDDIKEILALRDRREAPCRVVLDLLQEKAAEIGRRIEELQRMEAELRELHRLGQTFPTDDVDGKECVCHLVSERSAAR